MIGGGGYGLPAVQLPVNGHVRDNVRRTERPAVLEGTATQGRRRQRRATGGSDHQREEQLVS